MTSATWLTEKHVREPVCDVPIPHDRLLLESFPLYLSTKLTFYLCPAFVCLPDISISSTAPHIHCQSLQRHHVVRGYCCKRAKAEPGGGKSSSCEWKSQGLRIPRRKLHPILRSTRFAKHHWRVGKEHKLTIDCSRAPAPPQIEHTDDSVSSLVDVDSPHISSVPSDYESQPVKTDTQAERIRHEEEVKREAKRLKEAAAAKKEAAKDKIQKNAGNPVVLSNAVGLAVVSGILGIGAYRKYSQGQLTGKLVAAWAGVIGLFGVGDYFVSQ